jgi:hypothetical protein
MDRRTGAAFLLLAAAGLAVAGAWSLVPEAPGPAEDVEVGLAVHEPDGYVLFEGLVRPANATALASLAAGAEAGDFPYETETYSAGVQVVSVNGTRNEGSSGWVYRVRRDGTWCWGDRAPDRYEVADGDRIRWEWAEEPPGGGCGAEPQD